MIQEPPSDRQPTPRKTSPWLRLFQPAPDAAVVVSDPAEVEAKFKYWQRRILISSLIGYALFYFVRKNLGVAMPMLEKEGITKTDLGLFLTLHGVLYGLSKFVHGFVADRANARAMMVAGLVLCSIVNLCFGFSSATWVLGVFWILNGWFQGVGFPPCARLMTHWFSPTELATKMSFWNTSHSIGAAAVAIVCGWLITTYGGWRLSFWVPGIIAMVGAVFLWLTLRDTPRSLGLPDVPGTHTAKPAESPEEYKTFVRRKVFGNPYIWLIAIANFFVYTVRYAFFDWGTTLLKESKGMEIGMASTLVAIFEVCGVVGMLASGWLTDKVFGGRGARLCFFSMLLSGAAILVFWKLPAEAVLANSCAFAAIGFFIYGPQALVGIAVANLATKRAAASAVGLTGIFGYASGVLSGWGVAKLAHTYGWGVTFQTMLAAALIGGLLFAATWRASAHGYTEER